MYTAGVSLDKSIARAREFVLKNDRIRYMPLLKRIEETAKARHMIIGGFAGCLALLGDLSTSTEYADAWCIELYSDTIKDDMHKCFESLFDIIAPYDSRTAFMRTIDQDHEYSITINYRTIAIGRSLGTHGEYNIGTIIETSTIRGPFGTHDSILMSIDMQIMFQLRYLMDPMRASNWASLIMPMICKLFAFQQRHKDIKGGIEDIKDTSTDTSEEDIDFSHLILIGETAVAHYMGLPVRPAMRKQYIGTHDGLGRKTSRKYHYSIINMHSPDDFRLYKAVIRDMHGNIVCDIYNTCAYDVVPYITHNDARIGSPIAVLRFLFVEMWALAYVIRVSGNNTLVTRRTFLHKLAQQFFEWILRQNVSVLFPIDYDGIFILEKSAKKLASMKHTKKDTVMIYAHANKKELESLLDENTADLSTII